jgi:hypothetical protein
VCELIILWSVVLSHHARLCYTKSAADTVNLLEWTVKQS